MDVAARLQSHPLFASFSPESLAEVVRAGTMVTYQPGDVCIHQGEASEVFGVLISGRLEAVRHPGTAHVVRLGKIHAGECFGEMSLLTGNPTGAGVVAAEQSQAVLFLQEAIGPILAVNRDAVRFLSSLMSRRLRPRENRTTPPRPVAARYALGASQPMRILTISSRRNDLRYSYFDTSSQSAVSTGSVVGLGAKRGVHAHSGPNGPGQHELAEPTHEDAVAAVFEAITAAEGGPLRSPRELSAIGHRVCHGGLEFNGPALVDDEVKSEIDRLADLAPMENPCNLRGIEACQKLAPGVPQVAVFDTSFHLRMPSAASQYALPADLARDPQLRRFAGHGISHEGAARAACVELGMSFDTLKLITCHLGSGASLTAIDHGRPVDSTMGTTSLEGLVMSTRCGDVDAGLILHLVADRGVDPIELRDRLYTASGLLGLSGVSGDVQTVQAAADEGDPQALLAMGVFCRRARKYLAAYVGLLGGVDAIVFTGGVGQNEAGLRARICQGLEWTGIVLDEFRNRAAKVAPGQAALLSADRSRARVLAVGSNEDHTIACQTVRAVSQKRVTEVIRGHHKPIPLATSAHHVHLTGQHLATLFGAGHELTRHADLSQPGQFACREMVTLVGPKSRIDRVRVLGPERSGTQVEISRTEEFKLGIDAPVRLSGDLDGSPSITLEGPAGRVELEQGVICAMRHIHMTPQDAIEFAVRDRDMVRVRVPGDRELIFGDVVVRVSPDYRLDMHIDTDEANAAELTAGTVGYLDSIQERSSP